VTVPSRALFALLLAAVVAVSAAVLLPGVSAHPVARSVGGSPTPTPATTPTPSATPTPTATPTPPATPATLPTRTPIRTPSRTATTATGAGTYQWAATDGAVLGSAGTLRRFKVAVEKTVAFPVADFAGAVDATLGDPRSWIADNVRLQRVAGSAAGSDFTIYLASPWTAYDLCRRGGVDIRVNGTPYTSCRAGNSVVINSSRWFNAVPKYGAPLSAYREYVINHEVGHRLGHGHELCPGPGQKAPVMQQQTLSLAGCVAYSWPYADGQRYAGPPGSL